MIAENFTSYVIQVGLILVVGLVAPRLFRLRSPRWTLRYWQVLLAAVLLLPILQPWRVVEQGVASVKVMESGIVGAVTTSVSNATGLSTLQWTLVVVAAVAAMRMIWLAVGLVVLHGYRKNATPVEALPPGVVDLRRRADLDTEILVSDAIPAPVTFGWHRPAILVPTGFEDLPEGQQVGVACHELLHVSRRDWPMLVAEQALRALLWFHPAVHVLLRRIALAREQVIDREVVRLTGLKRQYLDALWTMARASEGRAMAPALFLLNRSDLFERVALLAEEVNMSKKRVMTLMVVTIFVVAGTGAAAAAMFPLMKPEAAHASGPGAPEGASVVDGTDEEQERRPVRFVEDGELTKPKAIHKVAFGYPEAARSEKIQGVVVVETIIDANGYVVAPKILRSPHESFEQPTIDTLEQWKFEPSRTSDGEAVDVIFVMTIKYALDNGKDKAAEKDAEK